MEEMKQSSSSGGPKTISEDAQKNMALAIVGYIFPIIFFIPLITDAKNSPFAKFHSNQQLLLLLAGLAVNIVGSIIPFLGWFVILPLGMICLVILMIMGIINSVQGTMKKLPVIGGFEIIHYDAPVAAGASYVPPAPAGAPQDQKFCTQCGAKNAGDAHFCASCGQPIK